MNNETPTPRTDAAAKESLGSFSLHHGHKLADLSRTLERKLTALRQQLSAIQTEREESQEIIGSLRKQNEELTRQLAERDDLILAERSQRAQLMKDMDRKNAQLAAWKDAAGKKDMALREVKLLFGYRFSEITRDYVEAALALQPDAQAKGE